MVDEMISIVCEWNECHTFGTMYELWYWLKV